MYYQKIEKIDLNNGPGMRVSLFVSGCLHNCPGCFNKEGQDPEFGYIFTDNEINLILEYLRVPEVSGLSLLGGDPMYPYNISEVKKLCQKVKEEFGSKFYELV